MTIRNFLVSKRLLTLLIFLGATLLLLSTGFGNYGFRWVATPSIPKGLYISEKIDEKEPIVLGQIYCFDWSVPKGFEHISSIQASKIKSVCKKIIGDESTPVVRIGDKIKIAGLELVVKQNTKSGQPLTTQWENTNETQYVNKNSFFVHGEHPDSFDSRYFKGIPRENMRLKLGAKIL